MKLSHPLYILVLLYLFAIPGDSFISNDINIRASYLESRLKDEAMSLSRDHAPPHLTVIIPAYNEEKRILPTLSQYRAYLDAWAPISKNGASILIVDDGSKDQTVSVVKAEMERLDSATKIEILELKSNRGKGAALAAAIGHVCSVYPNGNSGIILTTDADCSAQPDCIASIYQTFGAVLEEKEKDWDYPLLISGAREYDSTSLSRLVLRVGFRAAVRLVCGPLGVRDTQCGFKLMTASAARVLYAGLYLQGWSHDVEVYYRARRLGIQVGEQAIAWEDKEGSKITTSLANTIRVAARMFRDMLDMRYQYEVKGWPVDGGDST